MKENIALFGAEPIRQSKIFYGKQTIDQSDIRAVGEVLHSEYLTQGPVSNEVEYLLSKYTNAKYTSMVSSGTAALHTACIALDIKPGDEVITTPLTFAATANCIRYCGGKVVFADVDDDTYNIDPQHVESLITSSTKAVIAVDYAGNPADILKLKNICGSHGIALIEDAAHAIGSSLYAEKIGSIADLTTFSFHPVKTITGGEGGAVQTNNPRLAMRLKMAANHGITKNKDCFVNDLDYPWIQEQQFLGYNYRLSELHAALIKNQLSRISDFIDRRKLIYEKYREALVDLNGLKLQKNTEGADVCWHLFTIRIQKDACGINRNTMYEALCKENIIPQIHYLPVYWHPYYRQLGYSKGICPKAERIYDEILSLPLYPEMTNEDVESVIKAVTRIYYYFS